MTKAVPSAASPGIGHPDIDSVAAIFIDAFPRLNADQRRLALTLYRLLARGAPVSAEKLAKESRLPVELALDSLARWPGVFYDNGHAVIGFWGIAIQETTHHLEIAGGSAYAWCAWDALFIPGLLGMPARVTSTCVETGAAIELEISGNGIESRRAPGTMISFSVPAYADLKMNVTASFCHFVRFLRDHGAGERWIARHDGTFLLSLDQASDLGNKVNRARFRDALYTSTATDLQ